MQVQKWGLSIESDEDGSMKERITKLIATISNSNSIVEFHYPENLFEILESSQSKSSQKVITNLRRIALATNDNSLLNEIDNAAKKLIEILKEKDEAEKEAEEERTRANLLTRELEDKVSENLFRKSVKSQDLDEVISFMHSIGISASTIDNYLSGTYQKMNKNIPLNNETLKKTIEEISIENRKILTISRFGTKANFKLYAEEVNTDVVKYITEYVYNILAPLYREDITIIILKPDSLTYVKTIRPIELSIVFDNFLNNSIRAKAKTFYIELKKDKHFPLIINIRHDGKEFPI